MTKNNIGKYFEFVSNAEAEEFDRFTLYIITLISESNLNFEKLINQGKRGNFYNAESAFKEIFSLLVSEANSKALYEFYNDFIKIPELDQNIAEIVVDTIADIAKYRSYLPSYTKEDQILYAIFKNYDNICHVLNDTLDAMINAMMGIYELIGANFEERKMHLIKEIIPIITFKAKELKTLWSQDTWLIFFIACLKADLVHIARINDSRFRSFFSELEFAKIQKMTQEHIQTYLATAATENSNLREAKNLLKAKQEMEFLLRDISVIEDVLKITPEMLESAKQQLTEKSKLNIEILHHHG